MPSDAEALLARLRAYCFPSGAAAAAAVRGMLRVEDRFSLKQAERVEYRF